MSDKIGSKKIESRLYHADHTHTQLKGLISDLYSIDDEAVDPNKQR